MANKIKILQLILILFIFLIYYPFLCADKTVNPDAQIIFEHLNNLTSFSDYFLKIMRLQTIDFQPIRDFTLYIDLLFFQKFKINTAVIQNIFWWIASCWLIYKIQKKVFPNKNDLYLFVLLLAFSSYPLFSFSISWGIARKHLLSFYFFIVATYEVINLGKSSLKNSFKISIFYLLSGLSQPITLLWPIWALSFIKVRESTSWKFILKSNFPLLVSFFSLISINYFYYELSSTFHFYYAPKSSEFFQLSDKLLALGHYHFQIFLPYWLSFNYELGDFKVLIGLVIFLIVGLIIYKARSKKNMLLWLIPGYLTFILTTSTPHHLFDTYLLIPAFSFFMFFHFYLPDATKKSFFVFTISAVLIFGYLSNKEARRWLNSFVLTESSFYNRPNCKNALNFLKISYESQIKINEHLRFFLNKFNCFENKMTTQYRHNSHNVLIAHVLYHEDFLPLDERIKKLQVLSQKHLVAHLTLIGLLIKNNLFEQADLELFKVIKIMNKKEISGKEFHPITASVVHPYCLKKKWEACLSITSKLNRKPYAPYL